MTIIERLTNVFTDEKRTKAVKVRSWEVSGTQLPHEKNVPVRLTMSGCVPIYMICSHQDGDVFLGFPISPKEFVKLKWRRFWRS